MDELDHSHHNHTLLLLQNLLLEPKNNHSQLQPQKIEIIFVLDNVPVFLNINYNTLFDLVEHIEMSLSFDTFL